jgi:hypothetical protein
MLLKPDKFHLSLTLAKLSFYFQALTPTNTPTIAAIPADTITPKSARRIINPTISPRQYSTPMRQQRQSGLHSNQPHISTEGLFHFLHSQLQTGYSQQQNSPLR